jgi:cobalt-zinc-cadmium efflux system membrane fusion protein
VNTVIGSSIDNHDILAEVINPDDLHAEINVYERDILKIRKGQEVEITIPQIEDLKISGEVVLIDRELDVDTRTATVHVDIPENESLLSGMYVEANILLDEKKGMVVPLASLVREESRSFVYVLTNQSEQKYTLKKEFVNVGYEREGKAVIHFINAVDTTSMIATGGVYYLSSKID